MGFKSLIEEKFIGQYLFSHHYALVTHTNMEFQNMNTKNDVVFCSQLKPVKIYGTSIKI